MNKTRMKGGAMMLGLSVLLTGLAACAAGPSTWKGGAKVGRAGTMRISSVYVDMTGDRESVAAEIRDMVPLFLMEKGYAVRDDEWDYRIEIRARQRAYHKGLKPKQSISVEARVRTAEENEADVLPLAAGRVLHLGNETLSSSRTLNRMTRAALAKALRALPPRKAAQRAAQ
ncbi:MAG: hypothetical protein LBR16_07790 [Treponema sp.]|jgi:hypothetical protein|nr:hypothetical protein [Treponema sp.]